MALRLLGSLITLLNVHLSGETSKFSNSQLMSDIGIPLKLLSSKNKEQFRKSHFKKYLVYILQLNSYNPMVITINL